MAFYTGLAATAAKLLKSKGQQVLLNRAATPVTYNTADSSVTSASTPSVSKRMGALFDFGSGITTVRGNLVEKNDKQLLMEAGVVPVPADTVTVDGITYVIVSIGQANPAGTPVMYDLHLRAG